MKQQGRAFACEPCREIILFFVVSEPPPFIAALLAPIGAMQTVNADAERTFDPIARGNALGQTQAEARPKLKQDQ
jgi:hypothetical protein